MHLRIVVRRIGLANIWFEMSKDDSVILIGIRFIEVGKRCCFSLVVSFPSGFDHIYITTSITFTEKKNNPDLSHHFTV